MAQAEEKIQFALMKLEKGDQTETLNALLQTLEREKTVTN